MQRYPRFSSPIALGVVTTLASLAAAAQESPAGLEEVVVTAQRVETDIQKTPVAVTALTGCLLLFMREVFLAALSVHHHVRARRGA